MKFPKQATAQAWGALGWNDYIATYNCIVASGRSIPLRLARWNRHLESYLAEHAFDRNFYYAVGVEDAMLYSHGKKEIIQPCHRMTDSRVRPLLCPIPCDWCGKAIEEASLLCRAGLLENNFCSEPCIRHKLRAIIASDICLSDWFSSPVSERRNVPIPEDEEDFAKHFEQVPVFGICDRFDEEVYVAEHRKPKPRPMPLA